MREFFLYRGTRDPVSSGKISRLDNAGFEHAIVNNDLNQKTAATALQSKSRQETQTNATHASSAAVLEVEQVSAPENPEKGLSFLQLIGSALAAGIGVQSSKNRERDFNKGRIGTFVATGIIFTVLFIATVLTVVSVVLGSRS